MLTRRTLLEMTLAVPALALAARPLRAGEAQVYAEGGIAIRGADPVCFHTEGRVIMGHSKEALMWDGAIWLFAGAANREMFEMNPKAYAPRYGGYCAFDLSRGVLSSTVPEAWTIHDGDLYLTHSLDTRAQWRHDIPGYVARADANWPGILES